MDFYEELDELGLDSMVTRTSYHTIYLERHEEFSLKLDKIIKENLKVLLVGDPDPDGLMCLLQWKEAFKLLNFKNYTVYPYNSRSHKLNPLAVKEAIDNNYDVIIINDTGSKAFKEIDLLIKNKVDIIIIDHHQTPLNYKDYPSECIIINSIIENRVNKNVQLTVSAGALVFILLDAYLADKRIDSNPLICYALTSLYSDSIDMSSDINRGIYFSAVAYASSDLPTPISMFLNERTKFCRRAIEFQYAPRLNCAFRSELFAVLNTYVNLSTQTSIADFVPIIETLKDFHVKSSRLVEQVADLIEYVEMNNLIIANLQSVDSYINIKTNKLYNYTGLVANKLADRYKKAAVVYCGYGDIIKGSFRDLLSREYLPLFQEICEADGHNSAFGMTIKPYQFMTFLEGVKKLSLLDIKSCRNTPMIFKYEQAPDIKQLYQMALYNEFGGNETPLVLVEKDYTGDIKLKNGSYNKKSDYNDFRYSWGEYLVVSKYKVNKGDTFLLRPTISQTLRLMNI